MSRHVASPSRGVQSTVRNRRVDRKFKPRVLRQIQTGADRWERLNPKRVPILFYNAIKYNAIKDAKASNRRPAS